MSSGNFIIIAGDICPVVANASAFSSGSVREIFDEPLLDLLQGSLGNVANLETPLTDLETPIVKSGPSLISAKSSATTLSKLNLLGLGLANNHVLDQGASGFVDTMSALDGVGIPYFGGGPDVSGARKPLVVEVAGKRVGFYACAEHEFTIAGENSPGANPFDALTVLDDVRDLSSKVDFCVVLYHGMKEYYRYPSPEVCGRCHALVDAGADFVACQHSHCIGCMEDYGGGTILYGQGDFCFCKGDENEMRRDGLLATLDVETGRIGFLPVINARGSVRLAVGDDGEAIISGFKERSTEIRQPGFIEASWTDFCNSLADDYATQLLLAVEPRFLGFFARALRKLGVAPKLGSGGDVSHLLNILQCEAHSEVVRTALKGRLDA